MKKYFSRNLIIFTVIALFCLFIMAGCSCGTDNSAAVDITLSHNNLTLKIGKSETITVSTIPAGCPVIWSSENTAIATVDSFGVVVGVAVGSTVVTAKNGAVSASCNVTVEDIEIILSQSFLALAIDESETLTAATDPAGESVLWSSNNPSVADVSSEGVVKAVSVGTTAITAKSGTAEAVCGVQVLDSSQILTIGQTPASTFNVPQPENPVDRTETGFLSDANSSFTFDYTAPISGRYRLEAEDFSINCTVKDASGEISSFDQTAGFFMNLVSAETYTFIVEKNSTDGECIIDIYAPNAVAPVSGYTLIKDSMRFLGQRNKYLYTPKVSGYYYFTSSYPVNLTIEDNFGNTELSVNSVSESGISLEAGVQYSIIVEQCSSNLGVYEFGINVAGPEHNIDGKLRVVDSMRFKGQENVYTLTPERSGKYSFIFSYIVNLTIKDQDGNTVKPKVSTVSVSATLDTGRTYTIIAEQNSQCGEYAMRITYPN